MEEVYIIGIDLGGTKVEAGLVCGSTVLNRHRLKVPSGGSADDVLHAVYEAVDGVWDSSASAIGAGVPSVVDVKQGIVYDVQNIPSWKKIPLKKHLEDKYRVPAHINNDANCFALGEKLFGWGKQYSDLVGLIVGTGLAAGIVINGRLYNGFNCGAGEFGTIPYLDHSYEYYSCGQFFTNVHGTEGPEVYRRARQGDTAALAMYHEMGTHLGKAITTILYALDPEVIVLGGSVSQAYPFFKSALWNEIRNIAYHKIAQRLTIKISENQDLPLLGAAGLCLN